MSRKRAKSPPPVIQKPRAVESPRAEALAKIQDVAAAADSPPADILDAHLKNVGPLAASLRAPVPQLAQDDMAAVVNARLQKRAKLAYQHGVFVGTLVEMRRSRRITVEEYREWFARSADLMSGALGT